MCGQCRYEVGTTNSETVRGASDTINENSALARQSVRGDSKARKALVEKIGEERADKVEQSVIDSAAGGKSLFQRLSRGRR